MADGGTVGDVPADDLSEDLTVAREAAAAAAAVVRPAFGGPVVSRLKGAVDPVTEVDIAAEEAILAVLRSRRPSDRVLAEESGGGAWDRGRVWIVDPLDGTVNFVHGIPHVAVSVALWQDGEPRAGVVIDVCRGTVFAAAAGRGAASDGEPIGVAEGVSPAEALVATGFPYDRQERAARYAREVEAVLRRFRDVRRLGSAALDLAWVAAGHYQGYWEHGLAPWDAAAGVLLVAEAGGVVSGPHGEPFTLSSEAVVAAAPRTHAHLLSTLP